MKGKYKRKKEIKEEKKRRGLVAVRS